MKKEFEKNRLDLAYQRQLYHLNAVLLLSTVGLLSFIGTFIWKSESFNYGFIFSIIISLVCYYWYKKIDKTIRNISNEIKRLQ